MKIVRQGAGKHIENEHNETKAVNNIDDTFHKNMALLSTVTGESGKRSA
jgi:hypothetical protein